MKKFAFSFAVLCSLVAGAQKVSNKLQFQKGQQLDMVTTIQSASQMMGQSMNVNITSNRRLTVSDVSAGNATLENNIKRLQVTFDGMGQNQSYDSDKESDRTSEIGKSVDKSLKNTYSMTVDQMGKVTAVKPAANNPNGSTDTADAQGMMSGMLDGAMEGFGLPQTGQASEFAILPAKEITKGTTWTDTTSINPGEKHSATYTVADITASDIVLNLNEDVTTKTTKQNMGMEVAIDKKDKNTGKITLDRKTGLLKQKTITTETSGTASVMGQEIPLDAKSTKTVVVTSSK